MSLKLNHKQSIAQQLKNDIQVNEVILSNWLKTKEPIKEDVEAFINYINRLKRDLKVIQDETS